MKKIVFTMMCLAAMLVAGTALKAQEVTISLWPGWTWISYPRADTLDITTALGSFTPMEGDLIKSQFGFSEYHDGYWTGSLEQFYPGLGYMYCSKRSVPINLVFSLGSIVSEPDYVDLGLPSGTLWATCNVGASAPEEFGDCFAWGETQYKNQYDWSSYFYCNGDWNKLTKYCDNSEYGNNGFTDNLTTLLPEDDAATVIKGEDWRIPTKEEWQELLDNTTHSWTSQNGIYGRRFTASNGNSIFLPAAGYYHDYVFTGGEVGGNYWMSSLATNTPDHAWGFHFNSGSCSIDVSYRYFGQSVRAVRSGSQSTSFIITATAYPEVGGEISGGGTYQTGAECTLTATANEGYFFVNWTENGVVVSVDTTYTFVVSADRSLMANFNSNIFMGAINGLFSVSDNQQVCFSQGNLQYIGSASTPYWKFADNQWDFLGTTTGQNSSDQNVDRDLFGWGTSGWDCGNTCCYPWNTYNLSGSSYGPPGSNNLAGTYANSDWGVFNSISNGGNQPEQWRTLTKDEWGYVFDTRTTSSGIRFAKGNVNNVNGVILLPDDWDISYYSLSDTNIKEASYTSNTITASEWRTLERHGAVFMPATGYRFGTSVKSVGDNGYYWSSSFVNSTYAYGMYFYDSNLNPQDCSNRTYGRGVRLVRVVE